MKLMSFVCQNQQSFGIVDEGQGRIYDLKSRLGGDLRSAIGGGRLESAEKLIRGASSDYHTSEVTFLPVIPNPGKIICVGLNYLAHRREGNHSDEASIPPFFTRFPDSQTGHMRPLICPSESHRFDFEAEVAVVIGQGGRRIPKSEALAHVAGISCYNDGSVRDWQLVSNQWTPGKNFPATGAFGPWMVTPDEVAPDSNLRLICRLNGEEMQNTTTDLMMFKLPELISYISTFTALRPGDVIVSGTPGGVGHRRDPQIYMKEGDIVEIELEGVGKLRNHVIKEKA